MCQNEREQQWHHPLTQNTQSSISSGLTRPCFKASDRSWRRDGERYTVLSGFNDVADYCFLEMILYELFLEVYKGLFLCSQVFFLGKSQSEIVRFSLFFVVVRPGLPGWEPVICKMLF